MNITLCNLGAVRKAEIALKPLTIFVGPNAVGKTWTAHTLTGLFGAEGLNQYTTAYVNGQLTETYELLDVAIQQLLDLGTAQIDLVQFADLYGQTYLHGIASLAPIWLPDLLETRRVAFDKLSIALDIEEAEKQQFLEKVRQRAENYQLGSGIRKKAKPLLNAIKEPGNPVLNFFTRTASTDSLSSDTRELRNISEHVVQEFITKVVFRTLHRSFFSYVYPLPVERIAFIGFPFSDAEALTLSEAEIADRNLEARRFSRPVEYFLNMMHFIFTTSSSGGSSQRVRHARNTPQIQKYVQVATLLEQQLFGGSVDFSTVTPQVGRELLFQHAEGHALEVHSAASMVKELAPLVLYLRHIARPNDLLVIDEPEMNLHPIAQVRLTELLAMLINAGLNILLTTHSPYIVDHLANLIQAAQQVEQEQIADLFYLQQPDAFIPQENVSVYLFEQGSVKSILDEDGTIDWGTFGKVSDRISEISFELAGRATHAES